MPVKEVPLKFATAEVGVSPAKCYADFFDIRDKSQMNPQQTIGRYEIIEPLGQGGMGTVWRARDTTLKRDVALKLIRDHRDSAQARERFLREAQAAAAIQHPNLVTVFDYGQQDNTLFIAMELVEGQTLAKLLALGPLSVEQFLPLARQLTAGLEAIHARSLLHRDLKPANIIVTSGGQLKILDLGLAKLLEAPIDDQTMDLSLTGHGVVVGTLPYMSPEQASGEKLDLRSDLYSLGLIFFEMLTGKRFLEGSTSIAILRSMTSRDLSSLSRHRVPPKINRLIKRLLEPNPAERLASTADVQGELETSGQSAYKLIGAGALAVALVAGALWYNLRPTETTATPRSAGEVIAQAKQLLLRYERPGAPDKAATMLESLIQTDANHAAAHAYLSEAYWRRYQIHRDRHWKELASQEAALALRLEPALAHAHYLEGLFANDESRVADSLKSLAKAVQLDPSHARAWALQAQIEANRNQLAEAALHWQRARQANPNDWMPAYSEGLYHFRKAKYAEAESLWSQALAAHPDNVILLRNLGAALHQQNKREQAAVIYQRAIETIPDASTYSNLGTLQFFAADYTAAAQSFEKAVDLNPTSYLNWGNLGDAQLQVSTLRSRSSKTFQKAIELARLALERKPDDPGVLSSLALYHSAKGEIKEAQSHLLKLSTLTLSPDQHYNRAIAYARLGDSSAALAALRQAISSGYPATDLLKEPAFVNLHRDRRFIELVPEK